MEAYFLVLVFTLCVASTRALRASNTEKDFTKNFSFTMEINGTCVPVKLSEIELAINGTGKNVQDVQCSSANLTKLTDNLSRFQELDNCVEYFTFCSCCDVLASGYPFSGVYNISNASVYCEMEPDDNEAWLVIFYRDGSDDSVSYNQPYSQYKRYQGFGNVSGNHWIGLEFMHYYTQLYDTILRIELIDNETKHILTYDHFSIGSEESGYRLNVGKYNGTLPDYLSRHNNYPFVTPDKDTNSYNCGTLFQAGWWYEECWYVFFTGTGSEIYWYKDIFESAKMSLMPKLCTKGCN